jgi:aryl-alcohol dehydrogenase-like predicted oxidoreductase
MTAPIPRIELAPGYTISRLIKGGWQLAGGHGTVDHDAALADMQAFVDAGITTFDCADIYTGVESLIGDFRRGTDGATRRKLHVHTKCVPDLSALDSLTTADLERLVRRSCERLGQEALDLVQLHWWDYTRGDVVAAGRALAALQARGLIRHLGVTNFGTTQLASLLDAGVPIVSQQLQYSLLDRRPAGAMTGLARARGVPFLCYGALAGGFLHARWLGAAEPTEPLENRSLVKYKLIIDECGGWGRFQSLLALLAELAEAHGVGIGAIAIAWVLAQPMVASVIVGARNRAHLAATMAAARVVLTDAERARLAAYLETMPVPPGDVYELERDRHGPHGRIMRYELNTEGTT